MASNNKPPDREDKTPTNDDNPFVTFKKYADEQFASFFQNFIGLPSSTQLRDFDCEKNGRLQPICDLIDQAVEAAKITEPNPRSTVPDQQVNRKMGATGLGDSSFLSMLEEITMDPFERWQKHAERHAEEVTRSLEADHNLYRPTGAVQCPYRPTGSSSTRYDEGATIADTMGESSWSTDVMGKLSSDHVTAHRSYFGINSHTQNVPLDAWPLPYITMSPYSPLAVENQLHMEGEGPNMWWRHAFEDLVLLNRGYPMQNMNCHSKNEAWGKKNRQAVSPTTTGIQWVSKLIANGVFGNWQPLKPDSSYEWMGNNEGCKFQIGDEDGIKKAWEMLPVGMDVRRYRDEESTAPYHQEEEGKPDDEVTELDLYEHFLENRNRLTSPNEQSTAPKPAAGQPPRNLPAKAKAPTESSEASPPSIISTLATTERQVLPDGTVHTKVVLKKRFTDGREESNAVEHTTHADPRAGSMSASKSQTPSPRVDRAEVPDEKKEQKSKKGWFW